MFKVPDLSQQSFEVWLQNQTLSNFDFSHGLRSWLQEASGYYCTVTDDTIRFHDPVGDRSISAPQWMLLLGRRLKTAQNRFTHEEAIAFLKDVQRY